MIKAPWTPEQVEALNAYQAKATHPFTCPGNRWECTGYRELIATEEGWVCHCGKYKQEWAHEHMAQPKEGPPMT